MSVSDRSSLDINDSLEFDRDSRRIFISGFVYKPNQNSHSHRLSYQITVERSSSSNRGYSSDTQ